MFCPCVLRGCFWLLPAIAVLACLRVWLASSVAMRLVGSSMLALAVCAGLRRESCSMAIVGACLSTWLCAWDHDVEDADGRRRGGYRLHGGV